MMQKVIKWLKLTLAPKAPPAPAKAPAQPVQAPAAPAPAPAVSAPAPSAVGDAKFWTSLLAALMGKVPMGQYTFLEDSSTAGVYHDGVLDLWVDSDFVKGMLEKPAVLDPMSSEAARMAGRPVQVFVKVGRPPVSTPAQPSAPTAAHDNLNDLLALGRQFGNISIKE